MRQMIRPAIVATLAVSTLLIGGCGPGSSGAEGGKPTAHQGKNLRKMKDFMKSDTPAKP